MKFIPKITTSAFGALALAGLLAGCEQKASDTSTAPSATAPAVAPVAGDNAAATAGGDDANEADRASGADMSGDMAERHRQDMDHDSMRRGGPMGPGGTPTASESPAAAPMQDM